MEGKEEVGNKARRAHREHAGTVLALSLPSGDPSHFPAYRVVQHRTHAVKFLLCPQGLVPMPPL